MTAEQLKGIFEQCDKNGDGRLDRAELKEAFKRLGAMIPSWRAARGMRQADANGDGYIDEEEMTGLVNYALRLGYTVKRLDRAELKEAFKRLGAMIPSWRAARGMRQADANGDGYIDEEEMTGLVNYALRHGLRNSNRPISNELEGVQDMVKEGMREAIHAYNERHVCKKLTFTVH
ncbi:hypothetical protein ACH5RR_027232 [Cinchona calisaya]|uniref:EF-hand domain-containing protein n=1 Tax=Cinchona calisaya TaxID=153742 RepID=A0ABD2Z874_9GENT